MVYCIVVIFTDPPYRDGGEPISFTSLTSTFLTLNLLPLIILVFTSDAGLRDSHAKLKLAMSNNSKPEATTVGEKQQRRNDDEQSSYNNDMVVDEATTTQQREESGHDGGTTYTLDAVYTLFQPFRVFSLTQYLSSIYEPTSRKNSLLYASSMLFLLCYQMVCMSDDITLIELLLCSCK